MPSSRTSDWVKVSKALSVVFRPLSNRLRARPRGFSQGNIPFDILSRIFEIYTHPLPRGSPNSNIPWTLGHICRSWRETALLTPQCWNTFTVIVTNENADMVLPMHGELIRRSGAALLHISFDFIYFDSSIREQSTVRILEPALGRSSQWGTISILGLDYCDISKQFGRVRGRVSHLQSLKLVGRDGQQCPEISRVHFDLFEDAPSLSEVILSVPNGQLEEYEIRLPSNQLTTYLMRGSAEDMLTVELEKSPNLQGLVCFFSPFYLNGVPKTIFHHHLRCILLHAEVGAKLVFKQLVDVTLPSLETLGVVLSMMPIPKVASAIPAIAALITRSRCKLKTLVIQQNSKSNVDLLPPLLSQLPSLETLDLGHCGLFKDTFSALCFDPTKPTLLPNLQRLIVFVDFTTRPSDIEIVKELLYSRKRVFKDGISPGQLFAPLLYTRICLRRGVPCDYVLSDLEGWEKPASDVYVYYDVCSAMQLRYAFEAGLKDIHGMINAGPTLSAKIAAKFIETCKIYYTYTLHYTEPDSPAEALRNLCVTPALLPCLDERRWMIMGSSNLLYIHPQHPIRKSDRKSDMVVPVKFLEQSQLPEGYHYWLGEHIDEWFNIYHS